ncbi:hypothetical protein LUZ63_007553 [Rhynchospora breviuscula]|uniref:ATP-dependent DNA helicase n=1 Tax=Rhynchospora breviuscula TaxID=2022672 RepID=A0A9Q0HUN7_9POAL|nr:hypothetical protein LUZ63_007553 [Rhynchospora breviuscula]
MDPPEASRHQFCSEKVLPFFPSLFLRCSPLRSFPPFFLSGAFFLRFFSSFFPVGSYLCLAWWQEVCCASCYCVVFCFRGLLSLVGYVHLPWPFSFGLLLLLLCSGACCLSGLLLSISCCFFFSALVVAAYQDSLFLLSVQFAPACFMPRSKRPRSSAGVASSSAQNTISSPRPARSRRSGPRGRIATLEADHPVPPPSAPSNPRPSLQQYRSCLGPSPVLLDFGDPDRVCPDCHALFWYQERCRSASSAATPVYTLCCREGRVSLPAIEDPPEPLRTLLDPSAGPDSVHFHSAIRTYNSMFAFSSMGVKLDQQINRSAGPYVFRVSGQACHRIGSLTPPEGQRPAYAQLYFYDTANEVQNRIASVPDSSLTNRPREYIVVQLRDMLYEHNIIAQGFRTARDRIGSSAGDDFHLRISSSRNQQGVQYSTPAADEVVGLLVGDFNETSSTRDIIIHSRPGQLQRINPLHPKYFALQYPLLLARGEDSFTEDIEYDLLAASSSNVRRPHVTMLEYYRYRLHIRTDESPTLFRSGRLFQQICVDMYACIEDARLTYLYHNQDSLRMDSVHNIRTAVLQGDMFGYQVGKRFILPASFVGGPRYLFQNYQDALAVCRSLGPPHLFITFTCNPAWSEIRRNLMPGQQASDRPDLTCRVFRMKVQEMIKDIRERNCFGAVAALIYTVEFQKRGLPHVHIIVWLADRAALSGASGIDSVISAELPDPLVDPEAYAAVSRFMMHGPCGATRPYSPCMENGKCKKYFPKEFTESTVLTHDEFVRYRRRNHGITVEKNGSILDNRHVVPHNIKMLLKYNAHINVERCHSSSMVKYLFKYITKGHDRAIVAVQPASDTPSTSSQQPETAQTTVDEIRHYLDCRYLTPPEAIWRIFSFDVHYSYPSVERLPVHLPSQNNIVFSDFQELDEMANNDSFAFTKLIAWFELNKTDELARGLTYIEIPSKFTWKQDEKTWAPRQQNRKRLARMLFVHPNAGELYYLRMLLNIVRGPTSFEDIRTVNNVLYATFQEACDALGLLDDDNEWLYTLQEAAITASARQVRKLFVDILLYSEVTDPAELWDACWRLMGDDILYNIRSRYRIPQFNCSDAMLKDHILYELEDMLISRGSSLESVKLPHPVEQRLYEANNTLLAQQLSYNTVDLRERVPVLLNSLNSEQSHILHQILISVQNRQGRQFFVDGPGGTGKTHLWSALTAKLRSEGKIVLTVASSGLSSLLLHGGVTAYSRFKIPINLTDKSTCDIKKNSQLARLIMSASLIIWDEAPMSHRHCFESLDRTLRDLLASTDSALAHTPFGGMTVVLGGDFRQILPVVPRGSRHDTIGASIVHSALWDRFVVLRLTQNMRLMRCRDDPAQAARIAEFASWLLAVGDGNVPALALDDAALYEWIKIPEQFLINYDGDEQQAIIDEIYPDLHASQIYDDYLRQRAILATKNNLVDSLNEKILSQLPGQLFQYYSSNTAAGKDKIDDELRGTYPDEYLQNITSGGLPPHCLGLKIGVPVMLLRNINQPNGLCNGTRMVITACADRFLKARIITGSAIGQEVYIPRIVFVHENDNLPFNLRRKQFPVRVCYAMTINKSQGQSLDRVGVFLPEPINMLDLVKISDLPNRPHSVKIQARIIRVWAAKGPDNPAIWYYAAILMDTAGNVIEARIQKEHYQRLSRLLEEGRICEIAKFAVKTAPKQYHAVKGDHIISFTKQTTLTPLASSSLPIPMHYFDLQRLDAVGTDITDTNKMIDIIGRIAGFSPVRPDTDADHHKPAQMIYLADERGYMLEVTLWRQFLPLFDTARLHEESKNGPVVIICDAVQINEWDDVYNVKAISSTRFYFDRTIPEIARFIASLPSDLPPIILNTEGPPYDGVPVTNVVQQIQQPDPQTVTISEFLAIPVTTYSDTLYKCVASITDLINRYEWHYDACKKCTSRLKNRYCQRCAMHRDDFIDWYKLQLQVKDQTGTAEFTALGKVAKIIIGADVKAMVKEQDTTDNDAPQQVLAIIGKAYQFTVLPKESTKFEGVRMNTIIRVDAVPPTSSLFLPIEQQDPSTALIHTTGAATSKALSNEIISDQAVHSPQHPAGSTPSTPPPTLDSTTPIPDKQQPSPDEKGFS